MGDSNPDTTPAGVLLQSSPTSLSVEDSEIPPAAQVETELSENIGIVDEILNISTVDTEPCEAEVEAPSENEMEEEIVQEVSVQIEDSKEEDDLDVAISKEEEPDDTETKCTGEQNTESPKSTSEVTEILEKIDNEVDISNTTESKFLPTAQDENKGGDVAQNTEQLQSSDLPVIANDAPTKTEENKDGDAEQLETTNIPNANAEPAKDVPPKDNTPSVGREILFADEAWSQLWAAIPDRQLSFTGPVLRVEAGRFFWSSETYNKR